ncbi:transcription factor bHLH91-like [Senna tora]|uniref:Transcription factor bHLH91-like n=1 Tax=Senna tora TaxID=362788 RepID=A0A834SN69_9FABA|nr:transcription factor bHLH91-like [Senna tora]
MAEGAVSQDSFPQTVAAPLPPSPPLMAAGNGLEENLRHCVEELSYHHHQHNPPRPDDASAFATSVEIAHPQHPVLNMGNSYNNETVGTHLVQHVIDVLSYEHSSWDPSVQEFQDLVYANHYHDQQQQQFQQMEAQSYNNSSSILGPSPDLLNLNLLHLPRSSANSSLLANSTQKIPANFQNSIGFLGELSMGVDTASASSVMYDPLFHFNLPPQPPAPLKELFQSPPRGYSLPPSSRNGGSLFGGGDDTEGNGIVYQDGDGSQLDNNGVLEFNTGTACVAKGREGKGTKHVATEKQRREQLNGKYHVLRSLIPNPTKADRASVVGDAIGYIRELIRTVNELKLLVEKKRFGRDRCKRHKGEDDASENCNMKSFGDPDGCIRTSWLQRKSKDTEVDVRIIDDEVTIKLVQRRKISCLLFVSEVLDELELDLHHVAGGHVGEYCSFLFNSKINEGSSIYASAIANKVIEVLDREGTTTTHDCHGKYNFALEKQRREREELNGKYTVLRTLIPKLTKVDRESVMKLEE